MLLSLTPLEPEFFRQIGVPSRTFPQHNHSRIGLNPIFSKTLDNIKQLMCSTLLADECGEVYLDISAAQSQIKYPCAQQLNEDDLAVLYAFNNLKHANSSPCTLFYFNESSLANMSNNTIFPIPRNHRLTVYSFCLKEDDMNWQCERMELLFTSILHKLELPTYILPGEQGDYHDKFVYLDRNGSETIFYNNNDIAFSYHMPNSYDVDTLLNKYGITDSSYTFFDSQATKVGEILPLGRPSLQDVKVLFGGLECSPYYIVKGVLDINKVFNGIITNHTNNTTLIFPKSITPFQYHIIAFTGYEEKAMELYKFLTKEHHIQTLYDDRAYISFNDKLDLAWKLGIPNLIFLDNSKHVNNNLFGLLNKAKNSKEYVPYAKLLNH